MKRSVLDNTDRAISPRFAMRMDCSGFAGAGAVAMEAFPRRVKAAEIGGWGMRKRPRRLLLVGPNSRDIVA